MLPSCLIKGYYIILWEDLRQFTFYQGSKRAKALAGASYSKVYLQAWSIYEAHCESFHHTGTSPFL